MKNRILKFYIPAAFIALILLLNSATSNAGMWADFKGFTLEKNCSVSRMFKNKPENWIAAAGLVALLADWGTTRDNSYHYDTRYELNEHLGKYPSRKNINHFFLKEIVTDGIINACAKPWLRNAVNIKIVIVNGSGALGNIKAGLTVNFKH